MAPHGIYKRIRPGCNYSGKGAVFLDRDGVLIEDSGYLADPSSVRFIAGAAEAVAELNRAGIPVIVVTNQSGIGRGYYGWRDFEAVQSAVESELARVGGWLDGVWACAYHEDGVGDYRFANHPFRKPNPGMILDAAEELGLDVSVSWLIGDRASDMEAGRNAAIQNLVLVGAGSAIWTARQKAESSCISFATMATDLRDAAQRVLHSGEASAQ